MFLLVFVGPLKRLLLRSTCHSKSIDSDKSSYIGKKLALMDIKLIIASIVNKYHIHFDPREDSHRVSTEMQDHFTAIPVPLSLVFKARND